MWYLSSTARLKSQKQLKLEAAVQVPWLLIFSTFEDGEDVVISLSTWIPFFTWDTKYWSLIDTQKELGPIQNSSAFFLLISDTSLWNEDTLFPDLRMPYIICKYIFFYFVNIIFWYTETIDFLYCSTNLLNSCFWSLHQHKKMYK